MKLHRLQDRLTICQLPADDPTPQWLPETGFQAVVRTHEELSIICESMSVPASVRQERDWGLYMVLGQLEFSQTGVISSLAGCLADAGISLFAMSTFDTDYILVKESDMDDAARAWRQAGHEVI